MSELRPQWIALAFIVLTLSTGVSSVSLTEESSITEDKNDASVNNNMLVLSIEPPNSLLAIVEGVPHTVNISLSYNSSDIVNVDPLRTYTVRVTTSNPITIQLSERTWTFSGEDVASGAVQNLTITGYVIGYVDLTFYVTTPEDEAAGFAPTVLVSKYLVTVVRESNLWDNIFTLVMLVLSIINTVNMGCGLDLIVVKQCLLKPIGPIVGFISQFTFMPLFAMGMAKLFIDDDLKGFGLLVMGVCPGGMHSNFWTLLMDGDVNLSVTMTLVSSIAALGMMPLWIFLLSGFFLPEGSVVQVPYLDLAISLILLTVPISIGLLIRRYARKVADFVTLKFIKPFSFVLLFIVFGLGFYSLSHIFILLTWKMCLAGMCVAVAGFSFGALFAWATRLPRPQIVAISLETALQNGSIAFILLKLSFPSPYSDMAALPPIAQMLMCSAVMWTILATYKIYVRCCKPRCCPDDPKEPDIKDVVEVRRPLMLSLRSTDTTSTYPSPSNSSPFGDQTIPPEFSWVKTSSLIVPKSPASPVVRSRHHFV